MDHSNRDDTGLDSSNDEFDLASPSFYELDRPAMSISPIETEDGPAVSASPIPPLLASPEQQPMNLSVGGGQSARTPARPQTRRTVGQNGQNEAGPVHASASFRRPVVLLQDNVRSRLIQHYSSEANSRPDTILVIVDPWSMGAAGRFATPAPPPMGAAGRSATMGPPPTPSRQTGSGLGAIRHRRHSTVGTSTAAGGQLRRSGRTGRETAMPQLDDMAAVEWEDARSDLLSPRPVRRAAADQQAASDDESIARKQRQADES
ncbi:uncharacterized protein LOC120906694 [Anopheles arabiensis]|uniref:uncharacterized protein LOC120906694 n=1 Tax=Anopheles arabiensis TaxID=7173 RepID=UPI001AACCA95|nr:uncharacterized protein LOC120906694 [Anopheles arabiensis]